MEIIKVQKIKLNSKVTTIEIPTSIDPSLLLIGTNQRSVHVYKQTNLLGYKLSQKCSLESPTNDISLLHTISNLQSLFTLNKFGQICLSKYDIESNTLGLQNEIAGGFESKALMAVSDNETNRFFYVNDSSELFTLDYDFDAKVYGELRNPDVGQSWVRGVCYNQKNKTLFTWGNTSLQISVPDSNLGFCQKQKLTYDSDYGILVVCINEEAQMLYIGLKCGLLEI